MTNLTRWELKMSQTDFSVTEFSKRGGDLLGSMIKALVDDQDAVQIKPLMSTATAIFNVQCNPSDLGKIIGKQGTNIMAIRRVLGGMAARYGCRSIIELEDYNAKRSSGPGPQRY